MKIYHSSNKEHFITRLIFVVAIFVILFLIGLLLEQPINPHSRYPGGCLGPIPVVLTAMIGIPFMAISVLMDILILIFKKELSLVKFIINLALLGSFIFILFLLGNIY